MAGREAHHPADPMVTPALEVAAVKGPGKVPAKMEAAVETTVSMQEGQGFL